MSAALDLRLDALLAELTPPPVPAGLAARIMAAAETAVQEPRAGRARRATDGRDRRGKWRRGLVIGAGALGLAFSGAVAATLAGVPLPAKVEAVMAKLPLIGHEEPEPAVAAPRPRPARVIEAPVAAPNEMTAKPRAADPVQVRQLRRLAAMRRVVEARRAAGLPTPRADRMERRIERRMERRALWWRQATPEQRERILELRRQRQEARRARVAARRGALDPSAGGPPQRGLLTDQGPARTRRMEIGPVYGPIDPRAARAPASTDDQVQRLQEPRAQRFERLRQQRLDRQRLPAIRPAPDTRPEAGPVRREGVRRPSR